MVYGPYDEVLFPSHDVTESLNFEPAVSRPVMPVAMAITLDCRPGCVAIRKNPTPATEPARMMRLALP